MISILSKVLSSINGIITAVRFLTILPLPGKGKVDSKGFGQSMSYFPLVGLLIGFLLSLVHIVLAKYISSLLISVIIVGAWTRITGALHMEAFVDAADGFSAGPDRKRILSVMKDPNCGSKGVVALVFLIIFKIVLLNDIPLNLIFPCLLLVPAISRWSMVVIAAFSNYARKEGGLGRSFVENVGITEFFISTLLLVLSGILILELQFFIVVIAPILFIIISFLFLKNRIGGVTGDILGALNEIVEVIGLAAFLILSLL
ncbi:MAG: adenosylcobinamide-GDP ribazoletransferase [Spirochaetota bacterium]|nr:adenosylcobinamide-GDP ribazoletransferase [Spirochaetota bacterium]